MVKSKKYHFCLILLLILLVSQAAIAQETEPPAVFDTTHGYTDSGLMARSPKGYWAYYDYARGVGIPLCTRPECDHTVSPQGMDYKNTLQMMQDTSTCYALRVNFDFAAGPLLYGGKVYLLQVLPNIWNQSHRVELYESEVDGPTRLVASLGRLFPWERGVDCTQFLVYGDRVYVNIRLGENSYLEPDPEEGQENSGQQEEAPLPMESLLLSVSLQDGTVQELLRISAQVTDINILGLSDGVLYYQAVTAEGVMPLSEVITDEDQKAWAADRANKARISIMGVETDSGEKVSLDARLDQFGAVNGWPGAIAKRGALLVFFPPQSAEDPCLYMRFDLQRGGKTLEYAYEEDRTDNFQIYYHLTDETMMVVNFAEGKYATQNLKTGEMKPLPITGSDHMATDYGVFYDTWSPAQQTDTLLFERYEGGKSVAWCYLHIDKLLSGNTKVRDFFE